MHCGYPFSHASDFDGKKIRIRATVSGFSHEDDIFGRGDGRDLIDLEGFEHLLNESWVPLVIDTTDRDLGYLTNGSITKTKTIRKLALVVGSQIEFDCFVSVKQKTGYSYHGNSYWYNHPYFVRPSKIEAIQYDKNRSLVVLKKYENDLNDYIDEKIEDLLERQAS